MFFDHSDSAEKSKHKVRSEFFHGVVQLDSNRSIDLIFSSLMINDELHTDSMLRNEFQLERRTDQIHV